MLSRLSNSVRSSGVALSPGLPPTFHNLGSLIMSPLRLAIGGILVLLSICPAVYVDETTPTPPEPAAKVKEDDCLPIQKQDSGPSS